MEITKLSCAEFKTVVIRIPKELTEYGNSMKKTQACALTGNQTHNLWFTGQHSIH